MTRLGLDLATAAEQPDAFLDSQQAEALTLAARRRRLPRSKPTPSSRMSQIDLARRPAAIRPRRRRARACRTTLVSASCATRKQAMASSGAAAPRRLGGEMRDQARPLGLAVDAATAMWRPGRGRRASRAADSSERLRTC